MHGWAWCGRSGNLALHDQQNSRWIDRWHLPEMTVGAGLVALSLVPSTCQSGLPQMMGTRHPQKAVLNRENGRERPNEACYYASL